MRNIIIVTAMAAVLGAGTAQILADQTNVVQNLSIQLVSYKQGQTVTNRNIVDTSVDQARIGNRQVISELGTATGNSFSQAADLVVVTPMAGGNSSIQVRDGTTVVDVSTYFTYQMVSGSVSHSIANLKTGKSSGVEYSVQEFGLMDAPGLAPLTVHFDVRGVAVESWATGGALGTQNDLTAEVSGSGDDGGNVLILRGTVRVRGYSLEVVPGGSWTT